MPNPTPSPVSKQGEFFEDPASRIERLLSRAEAEFQRSFLDLVLFIKRGQTLSRLASLIEQGRVAEAVARAEAASVAMGNSWASIFSNSAQDTARFFRNQVETLISFDGVNLRAVDALRANQLRLVQAFSFEQRRTTLAAVTEGFQRGLNPRDAARLFRDSIGLTGRQMEAVQNFRRLLERNSRDVFTRALRDRRFDQTIRRAIETGQALSPTQVNRMVGRYQERQLRLRAETIARTEALRAVHAGNDEMYRQAVDAGVLVSDTITRTWVPVRDQRTRDGHEVMRGQQRGLDEPFLSGSGNFLRFPGDEDAPAEDTILCRCALATRAQATAQAVQEAA